MTIIAIILVLLTVYYAGLMCIYAVGFRRLLGEKSFPRKAFPEELPFISVIVPARNEEASIDACLNALLNQAYPPHKFEIIVVDDGSTDGTAEQVQAHAQRADGAAPSLHLVSLVNNAGHKSAALQAGVAQAQGACIATTDADCIVSQGWLPAMVNARNPETAFVAGPVQYAHDRSLIEQLQALETLGLVAIGAGAIGAGQPHICNSANVLYRRDVYECFVGREPISAGEDEALLPRIVRETEYDVAFCMEPGALVTARPEPTVRGFLLQRRRWFATGARYPYFSLKALFSGIYLFYLALIASAVAAFWAPGLWPFVAGSLVLKVAAEVSLLLPAARHFSQRSLLYLLAPAQLLQVPYLALMGLLASFGPIHWKGRRVH